MSHTHGQILSLAALISDAAKVVEAHYASSDQPYVPSLDDTDPHPLDERSSKELRTAIQIIEGACAQLSATVARPNHTIVNVRVYHPILETTTDFSSEAHGRMFSLKLLAYICLKITGLSFTVL